jgi:hypothetical protein
MPSLKGMETQSTFALARLDGRGAGEAIRLVDLPLPLAIGAVKAGRRCLGGLI